MMLLNPEAPTSLFLPGDHVVSQGMKERVSGLVRLSRAMAVEEATMETDIRKHDMFGVRPQLCRHNPGERHYTAGGRKGIWSGFQVPGGGEKGSGKLAVAGGVSTDHFLMVEVKGLPERRPALEMGDSVFLGLSPQQLGGRRREFGCLVVAVSGAWVALVPPPSWWAVYGTDAKKFPTVNIRLGFDRVLLRRMGSAIVRCMDPFPPLFLL